MTKVSTQPMTYHLKPKDFRSVPWKNGRGSTIEMAVDPTVPFRWRLSRAKLVESGPFSEYPGYDRKFVLLSGGPITISHASPGVAASLRSTTRKLHALESCAFPGEIASHAELSAPAEDFNLFTLRSSTSASVFPINMAADEEVQLPLQADEHFVYPIQGDLKVLDANGDQNGQEYTLLAGDLFRVSRPPNFELLNLRLFSEYQVTALWIVIRVSK